MYTISACFLLFLGSHLVLANEAEEDASLFEGDMDLTPEQLLEVKLSSAGLPSFGATKYPNWPKEIPYAIHNDLARQSRAVSAINAAIADYQSQTCLRFRRYRQGDAGYLYFVPGSGCSSPVGYWRRANHIKLAPGCWHKGIVIHEIMHSLGFYHEQSRPDRDNYVTINWNNIPQNNKHNFQKYDYGKINSLGSPYDYGSIMHYSSTAFGGGRVTIQPKKSGVTIGQRSGFSAQDLYQLKKKYGC